MHAICIQGVETCPVNRSDTKVDLVMSFGPACKVQRSLLCYDKVHDVHDAYICAYLARSAESNGSSRQSAYAVMLHLGLLMC